MVAAAFVSYAGPFNMHFREWLVRVVTSGLCLCHLPSASSCSLLCQGPLSLLYSLQSQLAPVLP